MHLHSSMPHSSLIQMGQSVENNIIVWYYNILRWNACDVGSDGHYKNIVTGLWSYRNKALHSRISHVFPRLYNSFSGNGAPRGCRQ